MKSKITVKIFLLFVLLSATFESCQKDNTSPTTPTGTLDRDKFLGTWIAISHGTNPPTFNSTMNITAGNSSESQIKIENFDGEGNGTYVFGNVSGSSLSLTQTIIASDTIAGSGNYNSNGTLSFNYTIRDGQTTDARTASAHK